MNSQTTPQTPTTRGISLRSRRRGLISAVAAVAASAGVFLAALTVGGQPSATAETVARRPLNFPLPPMTPPQAASAAPAGDVAAADTPSEAVTADEAQVPVPVRRSASAPTVSRSTNRVTMAPVSVVRPSAQATPMAAPAEISVSLGYDVSRSLRFANWTGESEAGRATAAMLVRMFGAETVCTSGTTDPCELRAGAADLLDQFNAQLVNGRCEGMAALAGFAFEARRDLSGMTVSAALSEVTYWSLSQVAPKVAARADETRGMSPSRVVTLVADRISSGRTVTLMMWSDGFAHSVLPVSVSTSGGRAEIGVYDPNLPGQIRTLVVDLTRETWTYADGFDRSGNGAAVSGSGAGGLGFVENSLRTGTHRARLGN